MAMGGEIFPTEDRVIVRMIKDDKTAGGIHLPEGNKNQSRAVVMAVGPDAEEKFSAGEIILFVRSGIKITWDGRTVVVLRAGEIIASCGSVEDPEEIEYFD